jgi:hypothetical protein
LAERGAAVKRGQLPAIGSGGRAGFVRAFDTRATNRLPCRRTTARDRGRIGVAASCRANCSRRRRIRAPRVDL